MRNIKAVFTKQTLSFFKNPERWGVPATFLLIPFLFLVLVPGFSIREGNNVIVAQFVIMFIGISMIGSSAAFISEDSRTMNLRFMAMAGVKPYQYLIGTGATILLVSFSALVLFGLMQGRSLVAMVNFLVISMLGAACSMLLGITLRLSKIAKFTGVIALILGVMPIMGDYGVPYITELFGFIFTQQVNYAIRQDLMSFPAESVRLIAINLVVLLVIFLSVNSRTGLDGERIAKA